MPHVSLVINVLRSSLYDPSVYWELQDAPHFALLLVDEGSEKKENGKNRAIVNFNQVLYLETFFFRSFVGKKETEKSKGNVKFLRCEF